MDRFMLCRLAQGCIAAMLLAGCVVNADPAPGPTADELCQRGIDACYRREWDAAWDELTAAIDGGRLDADRYVDACCARAIAMVHRGDTDGALAELDRAMQGAASLSEIWAARAYVYAVAGRHEEADMAWRAALRIDPDVVPISERFDRSAATAAPMAVP